MIRLGDWLQGLEPAAAGRALLAAGETDRAGAITHWRLDEEQFARLSAAPPPSGDAWLGGYERLAIETDAAAADLLPRLLQASEVASAFVSVERPVGSLRRRPWQWPFRVALLGYPEGTDEQVLDEIRARHETLGRMIDVRRLEDEPSAVDLIVFEGALEDAVARLTELSPVANAVVVLGRPLDRPPMLEAQLAVLRACTAAVASAIAPPLHLPDLLLELVHHASHAQPFDVALRRAAGPEVLLWAEPDGMERSALPAIAIRTAEALENIGFAMAEPPAAVIHAREMLTSAAEGDFTGERHEASDIAEAVEIAEPAMETLDEPRWCQARVGEDNVIRRGPNPVAFFIGPAEEGALLAPEALDEGQLPWEEENAAAFRLTVVFIPVVDDAQPQQAELDLPRFGRSPDVSFELDVAGAATEAAARILVLFRNRVLQTAVLQGAVDGKAELVDVAALVPSLTALDERRAFDTAIFANHTAGRRQLSRHSNGRTFVSSATGVPAIAERLAGVLAKAASSRATTGLKSKAVVKLLIALAVHGRDLFNTLEDELGPLAGAARIQIVSARSDWLLPIELVYGRPAPDEDAKLCDRYLEDPDSCDGSCTGDEDTTRLCPNAFWGLSKTIERHRFDPAVDKDPGEGHLLLGLKLPTARKRDLVITRALFGASARVDVKDSAATVKALGNAVAAAGWNEWRDSLKDADTELLVLCPHADYKEAELEIASKRLARGRIEAPYVTGGREVNPIVVLFGCRTTGTTGDPAGFAVPFMKKGARAVFHSSTDLLNRHATEMARRLTASLLAADRKPQLLSEVLAQFRREAVHDGLIVALAISAFGDADWRI